MRARQREQAMERVQAKEQVQLMAVIPDFKKYRNSLNKLLRLNSVVQFVAMCLVKKSSESTCDVDSAKEKKKKNNKKRSERLDSDEKDRREKNASAENAHRDKRTRTQKSTRYFFFVSHLF